MDLKSGYPFWAVRNGLMHAFKPLSRDTRCDVAIIGGGISGALVARAFAGAGHDVAVLEQRDIAWGSTAASTALLQYEIDTPMTELAAQLGEEDAVLAYRACAEAIPMLDDCARDLGSVGYGRRDSVYNASRSRDVRALRKEFELRHRHGFDVEWLDADAIHERHGFSAPAAILNRPAACVDPYRMTYRLLTRLERQGVKVHDRTEVTRLQPTPRGVDIDTAKGVRLRARHVVLAAGYAGQRWLPERVARNHSSYAFVTDPLGKDALGALARTVLWETARPYLYLRTTSDHRLLVGGEDDRIDAPSRRDARVEKKARILARKASALFPALEIVPTFSWGGTFAETRDGLPYFGPHAATGPRIHHAMAYGGNGITYSMLGADLLLALVERRRHRLAPLFTFQRMR